MVVGSSPTGPTFLDASSILLLTGIMPLTRRGWCRIVAWCTPARALTIAESLRVSIAESSIEAQGQWQVTASIE